MQINPLLLLFCQSFTAHQLYTYQGFLNYCVNNYIMLSPLYIHAGLSNTSVVSDGRYP